MEMNLKMKGWLGAFEGGLFEDEEEELEERCRAAAEFAARRKETGWRLTHDELYDVRKREALLRGTIVNRTYYC